jgi:hypothetical protein
LKPTERRSNHRSPICSVLPLWKKGAILLRRAKLATTVLSMDGYSWQAAACFDVDEGFRQSAGF